MMEYQVRAESGPQLLARLSTRPTLAGMDTPLFGTGPYPQDIIQISGDPAVGKSMLLLQWTARVILPRRNGGLGAGVLLVDTDHHQPLFVLIRLLEAQIKQHHAKSEAKERLRSHVVESVVKDSLTRLTILNAYDSSQLRIAFFSLDKVLLVNPLISLILVDSLPAFFWADRLTGETKHMDTYQKKLLEPLQKSTKAYQVSVIYTRPTYFQSSGASHSRETTGCNVRIGLHRQDDKKVTEDLYYATVNSSTGYVVKKYKITPDGILWL